MCSSDLGNVQKNFLAADYLIYPNEHTRDRMIEDYMIRELYQGRVLMAGYPRNTAFLSEGSNAEIIEEHELEGKQIIAYMPTWREGYTKKEKLQNSVRLLDNLLKIDDSLTDDQVFYVNLHPLARSAVDFAAFDHIKCFPSQYETYEFLNVADVLITDYSSVMFDFSASRKKTILFVYDKEEYCEFRGFYADLDEFPFPKVETVEELMEEISLPKNYDDTAFVDKFCPYEDLSVTSKLCKTLVTGDTSDLEEYSITSNGKRNVLIYAGALSKNGITASLMNLLNTLDLSKFNYFITFHNTFVRRHKETVRALPEGINYIPTHGKINLTYYQKFIYMLFKRHAHPEYHFEKKCATVCKDAFRDDNRRNYPNCRFDSVIQFCGYDALKILDFANFDCKKSIFVHSDMLKEIETRKIQRRGILEYAYEHNDHVALVTDAVREPTKELHAKDESIVVVNNIISHESIYEKSLREFAIDEDTVLNIEEDKLFEILNSSAKKYVTVGRFSPEKGHTRLIDAFAKVWENDHNVYLVIIGGHGPLFGPLCEYAAEQECADNIIIIKSLSNPYACLRKCDYFVLSSFYEAAPLVLPEANIVGLPVISTSIPGPNDFMKRLGCGIVENSTDGIYQGMMDMYDGRIKHIPLDYEEYNANAIASFESLV